MAQKKVIILLQKYAILEKFSQQSPIAQSSLVKSASSPSAVFYKHYIYVCRTKKRIKKSIPHKINIVSKAKVVLLTSVVVQG